ncbi:biliverdin-producing heme oxygenase [Luteibacter sp. 329MFSha]|uniref:biliverdin-producing heme oxygenase n=1 Tax=Luteibacter sp. 329MFSha TaxID=1798239 RepID=UPI0008C5F0B8|nr:biliverdin-producing heme oxygenase [Luteibacter sp. 329MFSha]SEW01991.1 Heme oxygenase [Luteibacter sp. 329MFSha]
MLREATRDAHEAAEASAGMRRLLAGDLDEAGYRELLAAQLTLFGEWEAERREWLRHVAPRWDYASRANALEGDLAAEPVADTIGSHPSGSDAPGRAGGTLDSAEAWGELYVIEGSALGGRLIVKMLRERFPHLRHRFYAIGERTAPWRRFQAVLDGELIGEEAHRAALNGALAMFARFQRTLQDHAAHV